MTAASRLQEEIDELRRQELALLEQQEAALAAEERRLWGQHAISRERGWFWAFFRWAWPIVEPRRKLIELEANRIVCDTVERVLERDPAHQYTLIEVPPGFNKSMIANTMPTPAQWLHFPWHRFFHVAGTAKVNSENSHRARLLLKSAEYQALADQAAKLHGHQPWRLAVGADRSLDYENSPHRGQRFARPFRGDFIGVRADFVIPDDLMQASDFEDEQPKVDARSLRAFDRFTGALFSRRNDEESDPVMMIAQGLGPGDLGERWRGVEGGLSLCKLAMEYDPDDPENHPDDPRTERGELLAPEFKPQSVVDANRGRMRPGAYEAQYNQRRVAREGAMFSDSLLASSYQGEPRRDLGRFTILVADLTFKDGRTSDDVAVGVIAVNGLDRYHLEWRIGRMDVVASAQVIEALSVKWQPDAKVIEDKANGPAVLRLLRDRVPGLLDFSPKDSKASRLNVLAVAHRSQHHHYPSAIHAPWLADYQRHCLNAPFGKPVDAADAAAMAEIWLQANPWAGAMKSESGWF